MKHLKLYILSAFIFLAVACSCSSSNQYSNGDYCAIVEYFNPKTKTESTYTLSVQVENNELVKLYFPKGGWLDDSHFTPPKIKNGKAKITTYDNRKYEVKIIDKGRCG